MELFKEDDPKDEDNWLSDQTLVQDCPWSVLKGFAMRPNYKMSARFVSASYAVTEISLVPACIYRNREGYSQAAH